MTSKSKQSHCESKIDNDFKIAKIVNSVYIILSALPQMTYDYTIVYFC